MTTQFRFSGGSYESERDQSRLSRQFDNVFAVMRDGKPRDFRQIRRAVWDKFGVTVPTQSISARLRDMRKKRFGEHTVLRHYLGKGVWDYQLLARKRNRRATR